SLEQLRRAVGAVNRHVAVGAVEIARIGQVVERRRLRAECVAGDRRVALDAELPDVGALQTPRIRRAVLLVAGRAFADGHRSVLEDERAALVGVAVEAGRLAGERGPQRLARRTSVRLMA